MFWIIFKLYKMYCKYYEFYQHNIYNLRYTNEYAYLILFKICWCTVTTAVSMSYLIAHLE